MRKDQIPDFIGEVIASGCPIYAIGDGLYVFGEVDVPEDEFDRVVKEVHEICKKYGERDHLRREIADHLRLMGRHFELKNQNISYLWLEIISLGKS